MAVATRGWQYRLLDWRTALWWHLHHRGECFEGSRGSGAAIKYAKGAGLSGGGGVGGNASAVMAGLKGGENGQEEIGG